MMIRNGNDELWETALRSLRSGAWVMARAAVDELLHLYWDAAVDALPTTGDIAGAGGPECPDWLRSVIDDRVHLWNHYAGARTEVA